MPTSGQSGNPRGSGGRESRTAALAAWVTGARAQAEMLPGAPIARAAFEQERELGGGLIAGGVAFRIFLWLVPFGLVVAALLSFWSEHDAESLEEASREFGVGAAAAAAATETLQGGDRNALFVLVFGVVLLAWFSIGALRALVLAHALAWQLTPPRIRRPFASIAVFNSLFVLNWLSSAGLAWLREQFGFAALLSIILSVLLSAAVATYAMWLLPNRAAHPRELLPGAALVAVGAHLMQIAVIFYFAPRLGRAEETYGAFGTAATMLVWLYVISRLITSAAFLNATLWARRQAG